jgi:glycosyltransferase involved in cell wall biosynthesis
MRISVVTPAHNEEPYIADCIASVSKAALECGVETEHIIVLNRCTDKTREIAESFGAKTVVEDARNLSRIRNAGARAATGEILVTIDADSTMSPNMLQEVSRLLETGTYVGGGVRVMPERWSLGIVCSLLIVAPFVLWHRVSAGMFWCYKRDFDAIGGFNETLACVEDIDFGTRLKGHGQKDGRHYGTIRAAHIVTSCRKFDQFGDWYFVRNPMVVYDIFKRKPAAADDFYYDARKG